MEPWIKFVGVRGDVAEYRTLGTFYTFSFPARRAYPSNTFRCNEDAVRTRIANGTREGRDVSEDEMALKALLAHREEAS